MIDQVLYGYGIKKKKKKKKNTLSVRLFGTDPSVPVIIGITNTFLCHKALLRSRSLAGFSPLFIFKYIQMKMRKLLSSEISFMMLKILHSSNSLY